MTNKALLLLLLSFGAGCHLDSSLKYDCRSDADCNRGNVCSNGACISTSAAGPNGGGAIVPTDGALATVENQPVASGDGGTSTASADAGSPYPMECTEATIDSAGGLFGYGSLGGTWIGCDTTNLFGDDAQVGMEFASDGTFYLLERHGSGVPTRTTNSAFIGSYEVTQAQGDTDLQLVLAFPSRTLMPTFTVDVVPARMHVVLDSKVATFVGVPLVRPASCDVAPMGAPLAPTADASSFWALAKGRWAFCNGFNALGSTGGLELAKGGFENGGSTYYVLYPDATGTMLVRGTNPADVGGIWLDFSNGYTTVYFGTTDGTWSTAFDFYAGVNDMIIGGHGEGGGPRFVRID